MTDTMVSTREVPWMKLGKIVPTMSSEEALVAGGLDFTVSLRDVAFSPEGAHDGASWTEAPFRKMTVADDTNEPFETVSGDYPVIQFRDALNILDGVDPTYVAAGTLGGRRRGFLVAEIPGSRELSLLDGKDPHELFAVIRTSHDRSRAMEIAAMPLRGRCMNQLTLATFTKNAPQRWTITHRGNVGEKLEVAKEAVANLFAYARELDELAKRLLAIEVSMADTDMILNRVLPDKPTREAKTIEIKRLWAEDETVGFQGTGWGLVNAVSSFYEWSRVGGTPESRFTAALDGFGQTHKAINKTAALVLSRVR